MNSFDPLDLRAQEKVLADNSERNKLTLQTVQDLAIRQMKLAKFGKSKLIEIISIWQSQIHNFSLPLPVGGYAAHGVRLSHHGLSSNVVGQR